MSLSADELLRSEPISSLRSLVISLNNEFNSKQDELRQMVGSKYHDFIESNDAIVAMAYSSHSALNIVNNLPQLSQTMLDKTFVMLQSVEVSEESKVDGEDARSGSGITDDVWHYLDNCDLYNASILIYLSSQVIDHFNDDCKLFDRKRIQQNVTLRQTVCNDCRLILLCEDVGPVDRSKALASLALLQGLRLDSLLKTYLIVLDVSLSSFVSSLDIGAEGDIDIQKHSLNISSSFPSSDHHFVDNVSGAFSEEIRATFESWYNEKVVCRISEKLTTLLTTSVESASQVSSLQSLVYQAVSTTSGSDGFYTEGKWNSASRHLLGRSQDGESNFLWNQIFQTSFMKQVERHLRGACLKALNKTKDEIIFLLGIEGISVNRQTLRCSVQVVEDTAVNSIQIFSIAERVRLLASEELNDISRAVLKLGLSSERLRDIASLTVLSRALYSKISQFVGHLSAFLREILNSLRLLVQSSISTGTTAMRAIAFIGRIAWLIRSKNMSFENLFSSLHRNFSNDKSLIFTLIDEDNFSSAFEIADVNGDGIVSASEAAEVFQALAVDLSQSDAELLLEFNQVQSLSFHEFLLLSSHIVDDKGVEMSSLRSDRALDDIVQSSYKIYSQQFCRRLETKLLSDTEDEFGLTFSSDYQSYRTMWRSASFEIDYNNEFISVPSAPSISAQNFIFDVTSGLTALFSVDVLQSLSSKSHKIDEISDINKYSRIIFAEYAISTICEVYEKIIKIIDSQTATEDFALQAYVDVVCLSSVLHVVNESDRMKALRSELLSRIDPVIETFLVSSISSLTNNYHKTFSLLSLNSDIDFNEVTITSGDNVIESILGHSPSRFGLLALPLSVSQIQSQSTVSSNNINSIRLSKSKPLSNTTTMSGSSNSGSKSIMSSFNTLGNIAGSFLGSQT
eukprot:gene17661-23248_t